MIIKAIKERRSCRAYKSDVIADDVIAEIIEAGQLAPSAHGSQAVEFIIVKDQEMKQEIFAIVDQEYVVQAPVLIVPVATKESLLPVQDISVASQNIFLQATEMGVGSVWKNVSPEWEGAIKDLLGVPADHRVVNLIPVGVPDEELLEHGIDTDTNKIHHEVW